MTASSAATAGGIASDLWFFGTRCERPPCCPRVLIVWVEVAVLIDMRGGITTGAECVGSGGPVGAEVGIDMFLSLLTVGFEVRGLIKGVGDGRADLAPIFSGFFRGEGEDGWRKGYDLGTIMAITVETCLTGVSRD